MTLRKEIVNAAIGILVFTLLCGLAYPLVIEGIGQVAFPGNANGQKVFVGGELVGSKLIGQNFADVVYKDGKPEMQNGNPLTTPDPRYFQTRPSGTTPADNDIATTFANYGPNSTITLAAIKSNIQAYIALERAYYPGGLTAAKVPVDAADTSASGVDPDISIATPTSRRTGLRPSATCRSRPLCVSSPSTRATRARILRGAGRQRAGAEPRAGPDRRRRRLMSVDTAPGNAPTERRAISLFRRDIVCRALIDSFKKLDPRVQIRNPVMFVVEIGALITTVTWFIQLGGGKALGGNDPAWYTFVISVWLWLTVVFANMAEAFAEGRGRAQADTLRSMRQETVAKCRTARPKPPSCTRGDIVVVEAGELIPGDGTVIEGIATVDESAITGESAPVIRESGGDRSAVTGGTRVTVRPDRGRDHPGARASFLDRMIALVEGAERRKTPNEIALNILLAGLTLIFMIVVATLRPFGLFAHTPISETTLIALLVALIPTTIGALLSAIGIAGMDRLVRRNVLALSGRAVEASGDVDVLLLDKTGTITIGNRLASEFVPMPGVSEAELAEVAQLASLADETPEGRSIVVLAKQYGIREHDMAELHAEFVPFTAQTRMSGVNLDGQQLRKGAGDAVIKLVQDEGGRPPAELQPVLDRIGREGGTPLAVARDSQVHGRDLPQGHDQGGHAPALRPAPRDGHPHDHDHRRQPSDRGEDRRGVGRRRLPRRGDPGSEARADQGAAGRRPDGRDDRRRHQRRARARAGGRRRRDEHRHAGRARGREHGRSRLQSDEAHRDRRGRQAAADHPRCADHVLDRQRRRKVLRDPARDLRRHIGASKPAARARCTSSTS